MHLSPEATVGTSRPFNLAIIQRLLLMRLVHYSIASNVARCVSSGGIRFIVPRDMHSYAFVAQRDTRVCLHFETDIAESNGTAYTLLPDWRITLMRHFQCPASTFDFHPDFCKINSQRVTKIHKTNLKATNVRFNIASGHVTFRNPLFLGLAEEYLTFLKTSRFTASLRHCFKKKSS